MLKEKNIINHAEKLLVGFFLVFVCCAYSKHMCINKKRKMVLKAYTIRERHVSLFNRSLFNRVFTLLKLLCSNIYMQNVKVRSEEKKIIYYSFLNGKVFLGVL